MLVMVSSVAQLRLKVQKFFHVIDFPLPDNEDLPRTKGLLLVGIPGTGESLASKATAFMFGQFLTWMAETTVPILLMATANNIAQLPRMHCTTVWKTPTTPWRPCPEP